MLDRRRMLPVLGAAAGGFAAAAILPMAFAHADDSIGSAGCAATYCLGSGGDPTNVEYSGFRPLFADWQDTQPTNVDVDGSSFVGDVAGSYQVQEEDYSNPLVDNAIYHFGAFTPASDNPGGLDSGGLSGASVYDFTIGPGGQVVDGQTMYDLNDLNVDLANGGHIEIDTVPGQFTNYLDVTSTGSGDWIQYAGSSTPTELWDSLYTNTFPAEVFNPADYLPPDAWFPDIYSSLISG